MRDVTAGLPLGETEITASGCLGSCWIDGQVDRSTVVAPVPAVVARR